MLKLNIFFTYLLVIFLLCVMCGCQLDSKSFGTRTVCKVLKAKHLEYESTNIRGDFQVVYYFLYEDGTLSKINLKDYMSFNVQDTLCWEVSIRD